DLTITNTKVNLRPRAFRSLLLELQSVRRLTLLALTYGNIPDNLLWRLPKLKHQLSLMSIYLTSSTSYQINFWYQLSMVISKLPAPAISGDIYLTSSTSYLRLTSYGLGRALLNVTNLEVLNVQANSITVVNETTFPWEFRKNVKEINLSQNPFTCTCDLLWFRKWLDNVHGNKSVKIALYPSKQYRCRTPDHMKDVPLKDFNPTDESCAIRNPFILVGVVSGCVLAVLSVTGVLCYRYRWYLRFYVYRLRRRRRRYQEPGEEGEAIPVFRYDVYLAHSAQDLDWIVEELMPVLEGEHGLTVCVEERDMTCGPIADNIVRYMDDSARVMLVVSDNYNREGWRQYEFEHILYAAIEQQKDVIVLLLGDVEAGRMTKDMRRMLTRGTFLQWGPDEDAKRVFKTGLRVALKTQDVNIQTLC
ncbi:hypothetical protein BaRGS_00022788, partial [Batillaria attramentaria]